MTSAHIIATMMAVSSSGITLLATRALKRPQATERRATARARPNRKNAGKVRSKASLTNMSHRNT